MKKINLPIAAKDSQKINLSNTHVGTTDFFRPFLNYSLETVPKDKFNVDIKEAVQGYPLAGPFLGQFKHHLNSFFVPYRTVMQDFVNFITGVDCRYFGYHKTVGVNGEPVGANSSQLIVGKRSFVPQITRTDFFYLFFPNFRSFNSSDYEVNLPYNQDNYLTFYLKDEVRVQNFTTDVNPFVEALYLSTKRSNILNLKPDVYGQLYYHDFSDDSNSVIICGLKLTSLGRLIFQLLRSLGYKFPFGGYFTDSENGNYLIADYALEYNDERHIHSYSALPLLALYKMFIDWYVPSKFKNNYDNMMQTLAMLQYPFRPMTSYDNYYLVNPYPLLQEVILYTQYPNDYFTNAFLYPNGSNSGDTEDIQLADITSPTFKDSLYNVASSDLRSDISVNTPFLAESGQSYTSPSALTSYSLRALRALNNYVRRNQIVGYKAIDRFLAHFGAKLDYTQTNRSIHIASNSVDVFPQVTVAQSDTYDGSVPSPENQQSLLGGKSSNIYFGNELKHDFETNEQGLFIVMSSVTPKIGYVQGLDRQILHISKDDFYTPEFDSLGVQPILKDELFSAYSHVGEQTNHSGEIFGYTCRYADYKYKQDDLSGDFVLDSRNAYLECLHSFRLFDYHPESINNNFLIGNGSEYDRIFMMSDSSYDHLQVVSQNEVIVQRHVDSAADVKDITDGSGQYVATEIGGNHSLR